MGLLHFGHCMISPYPFAPSTTEVALKEDRPIPRQLTYVRSGFQAKIMSVPFRLMAKDVRCNRLL